VRELIDINAAGEVNVSWSQRIGNLKVMLDATNAEINAAAAAAAGSGSATTMDLWPTDDATVPVVNLNYPWEDPAVEYQVSGYRAVPDRMGRRL
jgi:hypothetical protein